MSYMMYNYPGQHSMGGSMSSGYMDGHHSKCTCGSNNAGASMSSVPVMPQYTQQAVMPQAQAAMPQMQSSAMPPLVSSGNYMTQTGTVLPNVTYEQSYVENILRLNLGKVGTFYMTYENNKDWNAKIFRGVLEAAGRDHIIISDPVTGQRILLLTINLDYITFDEPLVYQYPGVIGNPPTRIEDPQQQHG